MNCPWKAVTRKGSEYRILKGSRSQSSGMGSINRRGFDGLGFPKPSDEEVHHEEHECECRERTHEPVVGGENIHANRDNCQGDKADRGKPNQNLRP